MSYSYDEISAIGLRVDAGEAVTREEAEAVVRLVQRTCKGPKKEGAESEYAAMREAVGMVGGAEKGFDLAAMDAVLREGCGADFNDVICQYPFDGKDHLVECPKCGQSISFRSPRFRLE